MMGAGTVNIRGLLLLPLCLMLLLSLAHTAKADETPSAPRATKEDVVALVKKTVDYYNANGSKKTFEEIDNVHGKFVDRNLYIFCIDEHGVGLADGVFPKMIGKSHYNDQDVDGTYYVRDRLELMKTQKSFWTHYKFPDPITHKIMPKSGYCEVVTDPTLKDILFCSGIYDDQP